MRKPDGTTFLNGPPSPLMVTLPYTTESPPQLYRKIAAQTNPSFLFESGKGPAHIGRYSFLGTDPYQTLSGTGGNWILHTSDGLEQRGAAAFNYLEQLISRSPIARPPARLLFLVELWGTSAMTSFVNLNTFRS